MAADGTGTSLRGQLLVATPGLAGGPFHRSVVVLLEHSDDGALGLILNRPGAAPLGDVIASVAHLASSPAVLYAGGPVDTGTAIALGTVLTDAPEVGWRPLVAPLVTVDLDADPDELGASLRDLRVFAGYAGWGAGQLEGEIVAGGWYVVDLRADDVFDPAPEGLWVAVLRRQPWPLSTVAVMPEDPGLN